MATLLILGRGKTGGLVAEIARERGHLVEVLASHENPDGSALTRERLARVDVVIDFTTPAAVTVNLRALLPLHARVVVGTTGWYATLPELTALAKASGAWLLHATNFSLGVQAFFRAARELVRALPGYTLTIAETHHVTKKDAPSGTALTLQQVVQQASGQSAPITSHREGDAAGLHVLTVCSPERQPGSGPDETLTLEHASATRSAFATGAVRAAEWLLTQPQPGVYDFADVAPLL